MNTLTLKELADIGSKAACLDTAGAVKLHQKCREAFAKAVLDAVGYKLPVDPDDAFFQVWKAGRAALAKQP